MLNIIIEYHKRKLETMLEEKAAYEDIVKESKVLDEYIERKMRELVQN